MRGGRLRTGGDHARGWGGLLIQQEGIGSGVAWLASQEEVLAERNGSRGTSLGPTGEEGKRGFRIGLC